MAILQHSRARPPSGHPFAWHTQATGTRAIGAIGAVGSVGAIGSVGSVGSVDAVRRYVLQRQPA